MGVVESLAAWGIVRPAEVVELAAAERLDLAAAAAMLEKESGGGRNVWGSDGVSTGGYYMKGATVTRADYERWKPHRARLGSQGVGPCQLTYPPLQDQADAIGGCWEWRCNVRIGFRHLAALQRAYGVREGFRRYNGSGPAAERYAGDAMAKLAKWRLRLGSPPPPAQPSAPPASPTLSLPTPVEDTDMTPEEHAWLKAVHDKLYGRHTTRVDYGSLGETPPALLPADDIGGFAINADARAYEARQLAEQARNAAAAAHGEIAALRAAVEQLATGKGLDPATIRAAAQEGTAAALAAAGERLMSGQPPSA